jgi:hypothetical protein
VQGPVKNQEIERARLVVRAAKAAAANKKPKAVAPPTDYSLVAMTYEPPVRKVVEPSNSCFERVYEFAQHTRDQYKARKYAQPVDPRGMLGLMTMIAHMMGGGMAEKAAFTASLKTVVAKIIKPSPSDGLPIEADQADLLKEIGDLAAKL